MTTDNPLSTHSTGTQNTGTGSGDVRETVKSRVSEVGSQVKHTAAEFGRSAADNIDKNLHSAAGALEGAASTLRSKTATRSGKVGEVAQTTATKLDATAQYLRTHNTSDMVSGVEQMVRRNPGASLAAALGVGFLIGLALNRDEDYD